MIPKMVPRSACECQINLLVLDEDVEDASFFSLIAEEMGFRDKVVQIHCVLEE